MKYSNPITNPTQDIWEQFIHPYRTPELTARKNQLHQDVERLRQNYHDKIRAGADGSDLWSNWVDIRNTIYEIDLILFNEILDHHRRQGTL